MNVDELINILLNDEDYNERMEAAFELGNLKDKKALEPLLKALNDENSQVKKFAAISLGKFSDPKIIEPLLKLTCDKDSHVLYGAVVGLSGFIKEEISKRFIELLNDPRSDRDIIIAILDALQKYKDTRLVEPLLDYWIKSKSGRIKSKIIDICNSWYDLLSQEQIDKIKQLLDQILDDRIRDLGSNRVLGYRYESGMEITANEIAIQIIMKNKKFISEKHIKLIENFIERDDPAKEIAEELLEYLKS
ncbi:MAG: HEAT repeat domain-containing protein [Candidatus Helarchaeota archaeon]